jgi:hypothetical protein
MGVSVFGKKKKSEPNRFNFVYPDWILMGYLGVLQNAHADPLVTSMLKISEEENKKLTDAFIELMGSVPSEFEFLNMETTQLISYENRFEAYNLFCEVLTMAAQKLFVSDSSLLAFKDSEAVNIMAVFLSSIADINAENFTWVRTIGDGDSPGLRGN